MDTIRGFIERNSDTYVKHGDVPEGLVERCQTIFHGRFPREIVWIWENMGLGVYEDGYLQMVNPEEYDFAFEYIDKLLEPTIVWGITALGDLLLWEGNDNWTISPQEGNRAKLLNVRKCRDEVLGSQVDVFLDILICDEWDLSHSYDAKPYLQARERLPKPRYGECYGYVPALALGGKARAGNLQIVDAKSYIDLIGQGVGKIISLSD